MNAIEISQLVKQYAKGPKALKGVDLTIKEGDFFALLGANGAGKTTLINIVTGLVNKTEGQVKVFGYDTVMDSEESKRLVGVVPQEFNFSIFEKVFDIIVTSAGYFGVPRKVAETRAEEVLQKLGLWEKKDSKAMLLSGGMKRRLMIARALVHKPKLLILDEPTAGVDVELRHGMWNYLKELNTSGTTILLTTHYLEEVEQMCRNVAIIKQGEIIKNQSVKSLLANMETQTYLVTVDKISGFEGLRDFQISQFDENTLEVVVELGKSLSFLAQELNKAGMEMIEIRPKNNRLEQLYLDILNN
jgi:ABC-2 type transport system ATP-binding protein